MKIELGDNITLVLLVTIMFSPLVILAVGAVLEALPFIWELLR